MTEHGHADPAIDDIDALIADLETEYTQIREFTLVAAHGPTNNCTHISLTKAECCKTL